MHISLQKKQPALPTLCSNQNGIMLCANGYFKFSRESEELLLSYNDDYVNDNNDYNDDSIAGTEFGRHFSHTLISI
jgi:uncharacterized protein YhbP (UPF0306 family)